MISKLKEEFKIRSYEKDKIQKQFIDKRVKEQLAVRWIAPNDQTSRQFSKTASQEFRQIKFIDPQKYPLHLDLNIYGHKISILSLEGKPAGVIIENEILASSLRSIFNLLWNLL